MKILAIKLLNGPNYWSNYRKKLVVMKLDLEEYEKYPTDLLPGFAESLLNLIPSLQEHRCSLGVKGGFLARMKKGTWLGHVIEHIALELQTLAGMDCGFGRTFSAHEEGVYQVIFCYEIENAGIYAAKAAVAIASKLAQGEAYQFLEEDIAQLKDILRKEGLGPSTQAILVEAQKRGIPYYQVENSSFLTLGYGANLKKIWATVSSKTSCIGVDLAGNKNLTKEILASHFIPVPEGRLIQSLEELEKSLEILEFPLVIKPYNGNHGRGITTNINNKERAITSFHLAREISEKIIVEKFVEGSDYRFLVVNYKVVAVAERTPAFVIGDGIHTIQQLIDHINQDPRRGEAHENFLTSITIDQVTLEILNEKKLTLESILPLNSKLHLKDAANLSSGGTARDVTAKVHPFNNQLAERIARIIDLDICGIDILSKDISIPLNKNEGAVIEVNAGPGLRMHLSPTYGQPRNVAAAIVDMLYPNPAHARIPLTAVTGTNGKTTVVRLLARFAQQANYNAGFTTTDGIYLNGELVHEGDCSGPVSARAVLHNPAVNFAILECARGGILRSGLGFDQCDVSIITNISGDHLGLNDIHSMEELARVKAVVAHSTAKHGYAILNAEDDLVYEIKNNLDCKVALFGLQKNSRIIEHCEKGGLAAYVENNFIILHINKQTERLLSLKEVPLAFNGFATCMLQNILPTILAGHIFQFSLEDMRKILREFSSSPENTPGRMNVFDFNHFQVMLDYAHNEGGYKEIKKFLNGQDFSKKIGIISAVGDRRPEDTRKIGIYASQIFDEIIIRHNEDGRGKSNDELTELLVQGIKQVNPHAPVKIISNECEAIEEAMKSATDGTFIFCAVDNVFMALDFMKKQGRIASYL